MAQGDIFSQFNQHFGSSRNFMQQGKAAGRGNGSVMYDMKKLLDAETGILRAKERMYAIDLKSNNLFKQINKSMKGVMKENENYLKAKQKTLKIEKDLKKIQDAIAKENNKGRNRNKDKVDMLGKQSKEHEYQLSLAKMQTAQMKKILPMGGKFASVMGVASKSAGVMSGVLTNIHGLFDLILAPIKLMGSLLLKPFNTFLEMQNITGNLAADIGLTSKETYKMKDGFADLAIGAMKFGGSMQDVATSMKVFSEETGKNRMMDRATIEGLTKLAYSTGLGIEGATHLAAMFDNMGVSLESAIKFTEDARGVAARYNLNSTKLLQNMGAFAKQLNGYEFKNGIKGLTAVAAQAQSLRYDLGGIKNMADKLFDPEGAIEAAAKLQTLGGRFAQMGDPFNLMQMAQSAPEEFAKQMMQVTKGMAKKGADGKFFITPADRKMIQEAADAMGEDANNLINAAVEQGKLADKMAANPLLKKGLFSDEDMQAIGNLTTMKNGKYVITMPNGMEQLLSNIPSKSEFDKILAERKASEDSAIERKNWMERLGLIIDKFMMAFTTPFTKLEGIFKNSNLMDKIEALGTSIADKIVPWIGDMFSPNGQIFKVIDGIGQSLGKVIDDVKNFFSNSNKPFLQTLADGLGMLFSKIIDQVLPYIKYGFGGILKSLSGLPLVGDSLGAKGDEMMLSAAKGNGAITGLMGGEQGRQQKLNEFRDDAQKTATNLSAGQIIGAATVGVISALLAPFTMGGSLAVGAAATGAILTGEKAYNYATADSQVNQRVASVQDGVVTSSGQVIKYPKGELLSIMSPTQNMSEGIGTGGGTLELTGTIRLETPSGSANLTIDDFKRAGIHLIANAIGHEQDKSSRGYGLNDSTDIKTNLAI